MVFLKKLVIFPTFFFLDNIRQENVFYDILEQNNAFLGKKSRNWNPRKIDIFLTHGFAQKLAIFRTFFFDNIGQKNVFYDILERKNAFLGNKHKKFKKSKNSHFSKGVNPWFCSKSGHFSIFFFLTIYPRKMCLTIF